MLHVIVYNQIINPMAREISVSERISDDDLGRRLWDRYHNGQKQGMCYCCGTIVNDRVHRTWFPTYTCRNVRNAHIDNLRICCRRCHRKVNLDLEGLYHYITCYRLRGLGSIDLTNSKRQEIKHKPATPQIMDIPITPQRSE